MAKKGGGGDLVSNRKAHHDYEILETFEAGLSLVGTEVKSLRAHEASLAEAYVKDIRGELWLVGAQISVYRFGNIHNHDERRDRRLLMHSYEIKRLRAAIREKGLSIIPLGIYLKQGKIKIRIGLAKGKQAHDKRAAIKEREEKRNMAKELGRG